MPQTQVGSSPIAVVNAGNGPGTVYNRDPVNPVFWGISASLANRADASILDAQTGFTVDGTQDIYCCALPGQSVLIDFVQAGYSRNSLLGGNTDIVNNGLNPIVVAANSSSTLFSMQDVHNYQSFDVSFFAECGNQSTAGAPLVCALQLSWYDSSANVLGQVYQETWFPLLGNLSGTQPLLGSGPMRGYYMSAVVVNNGSQPLTITGVAIRGTNRAANAYSTFRQSVPPMSCSGATVASANPVGNLTGYSNMLGTIPNIVPGTGLRIYPLPLYAGPVSIAWQVNTAGLLNDATLVDLSQASSGGLAAGQGQDGVIWAGINTTGQYSQETIIFPRAGVALVVNPATTSGIFFSAVGQQGF